MITFLQYLYEQKNLLKEDKWDKRKNKADRWIVDNGFFDIYIKIKL